MTTALLATLLLASTPARYLSAEGDDAADGCSPETAWRTVGRLNEGLPAGGRACLRAGDVFYGTVEVKGGPAPDHPTVVTSYGEGAKPVVSNTKNLKRDPKLWTLFGTGTNGDWRFDLRNDDNYDGVKGPETNTGFLIVDGVVRPWKKYGYFDINADWDFADDDDGILHVHLERNPAEAAQDIRAAVNRHGIVLASNLVVSNIAVRAVGGHGMCGHHVAHVRISDCDFENIGGAELKGFMPGERMRYGNGVEFWKSASDAIVERCTFSNVYDVAFTMQGDHPETGWSDVHFRSNVVRSCSQAFEIWVMKAAGGIGFRRCSFTHNTVSDTGGGWGELTRPNRRCATPLLIYNTESDTFDIEVRDNDFGTPKHGLIHTIDGTVPEGYRIK